jgi:endonuclease/exonuclease/phosphatase family metal-dependent hydrolase
MAELTLGSLNLHAGRGTPGHDAPLFDVVTACKEVDTDVLVLQEAWAGPGADDVATVADVLGYDVAGTFSVARATREGTLRLVAREGPDGDADWTVAVLSRLPVLDAGIVALTPQLRRDPGRRAVVRAVVDVDGSPFTVVGTHLPLIKDPVWRLAPALRSTLPAADEPGALVGDMNMWGWCADRLAGPGWRRAVRGRTYPSHRPHSQTDHVLVNTAVTVTSAGVIPQVMSDHRPVRARLRF